jgi:alpha-tubulin suppressor-like RCC1 family protein
MPMLTLCNKNIVSFTTAFHHLAVSSTLKILLFNRSENGTVYGNGSNHNGQLGSLEKYPDVVVATELTQFKGLKVIKVATRFAALHSIVLTENGEVYTFGTNKCGALGIGSKSEYSDIPVLVEGLKGKVIADIFCGEGYCYAITSRFS